MHNITDYREPAINYSNFFFFILYFLEILVKSGAIVLKLCLIGLTKLFTIMYMNFRLLELGVPMLFKKIDVFTVFCIKINFSKVSLRNINTIKIT